MNVEPLQRPLIIQQPNPTNSLAEIRRTGTETAPVPTQEATEPQSKQIDLREAVGEFMKAEDDQALLKRIQGEWKPGPHIPQSENAKPDGMMKGLFDGFNPGKMNLDGKLPEYPINMTDPETGLKLNIDDNLHFTFSGHDGEILREFDAAVNRQGKPYVEFKLKDGRLDRESSDGLMLSISPDHKELIGRFGKHVYNYAFNNDGELQYKDDNGKTSTIQEYEGGLLVITGPDGERVIMTPDLLGEDDGIPDLLFLDKDGNLLGSEDLDDVIKELEADSGDSSKATDSKGDDSKGDDNKGGDNSGGGGDDTD